MKLFVVAKYNEWNEFMIHRADRRATGHVMYMRNDDAKSDGGQPYCNDLFFVDTQLDAERLVTELSTRYPQNQYVIANITELFARTIGDMSRSRVTVDGVLPA